MTWEYSLTRIYRKIRDTNGDVWTQEQLRAVGTTWSDNLKRIRRYLRDPNGNIWSDAFLLGLFNDVQKEFQTKTNYLTDVKSVRVPPLYDFSYLYDFEWPLVDSETGNYQALRFHQQGEIVYCHRFEPQVVWGLTDSTATEEGTHFTHPFEAFLCDSPGDLVPLQFPEGFHNAILVAWDKEPIDFITRKQITQDDPSWATRTGEPYAYWRPDQFEDQFCLYPIPSTVSWDTYTETQSVPLPDYIYAFPWEETAAYISGSGQSWTREDTANSRQYIHEWESDIGVGEDRAVMYGMWSFEIGSGTTDHTGIILYTSTDTVSSEFGIVVDTGDEMLTDDIVDPDDNVLFIYTRTPTELTGPTDSSTFPDYLQKYIEYGVLERAYGADTDGQIPSLRDYWAYRKEIGINAIKKFMSMKRQDRDYRLVTKGAPGFRTRRQPRLPDAYPAVG